MKRDYRTLYREWCESEVFDLKTREELLALEDENEMEDRFYRDLEFGTGGLRGIIGAGTNRMNLYTVGKASQGIANIILQEHGQEKGVAIAYDSRRMSEEFALATALCFNANGIKVYLFDGLRPTPELSFAVRHLGCIAGVVITASHNPAEYNGYKVYWSDGCQITFPKDREIIEEVNGITDYGKVKTMREQQAREEGLLIEIGESIDQAYMEELKELVMNPEIIKEMASELCIVYTPVHGTGNLPVRRILEELGFTNVHVVEEQALPDGAFPTVSYPNPEDPAVFEIALTLAREVDADIVLATDPDADRLGVYAKDSETKEYHPFTGNMSGILIAAYELEQKKKRKLLTEGSTIIKTIVTTNMANALAKDYEIHCVDTLTGFKYIGALMSQYETIKDSYVYEFGFEESYGCLLGNYARDKDAVVAVMALCEAAAYYKKLGETLWEQMIALYETYGYYSEELSSLTLKGIDGVQRIGQIMEAFRGNIPRTIGGWEVVSVSDFLTQKKRILAEDAEESIDLPQSNVLYYELSEDAWFCVRPSGTEPKIKFYYGVKECSMEESKLRLVNLKEEINKMMSI